MSDSLAQRVAALDAGTRAAVLGRLTDAELASWAFWARPNQLPPTWDWRIWLILAGRGFGKTRTGAETVRAWVTSGHYGRIALVAPTAADARDVMVEGESGLLAVCAAQGERPLFEPSKRRVTWASGATATLYSAEEPERLRGPQHGAAWCDEVCAWARMRDTWDMLQFGLRLGDDPRAVVTTTPKPVALVREWLKREGQDVAVTRGSTYDNAANLAAPFLKAVRERYEGTALGRQELYAAVLDEAPGALWRRAWFERLGFRVEVGRFERVGVGVDPSVSATGGGDACGIVAAGLLPGGDVVVLEDATVNGSPAEWARKVGEVVARWGASVVAAETNQGGALVTDLLRGAGVERSARIVGVAATVGKAGRAEPVSARYEQGRVRHRAGADLRALEDEMVTWVPGVGRSPNRVDALVHVVGALTRSGGDVGASVF